MKNNKAYNAPLHYKDSSKRTYGCRHSTPDNCIKNMLVEVCAFVRPDNLCMSPPRTWSKHFRKLKDDIKNQGKSPEESCEKSPEESPEVS